jgi:hypothetical protein
LILLEGEFSMKPRVGIHPVCTAIGFLGAHSKSTNGYDCMSN